MPLVSNPSNFVPPCGETEGGQKTVLDHLTSNARIPVWSLCIVVAFVVFCISLVVVQQFRVWRLDRLQKAAQVRINELTLDVRQTELRVKSEFYQGKIKVNEEEQKRIDKELDVIKKRKDEISKDANRMTPGQLRDAFRNESGPETRPVASAQKCGGCK